jgi:hypothetical protein
MTTYFLGCSSTSDFGVWTGFRAPGRALGLSSPASPRAALRDQVDTENTHLHTDGGRGYLHLTAEHSTVDHSTGEYVRGDVTTNHAESYFSQLKRSLDGTHHHVSRAHQDRYLAEFDFRYTTCKQTDSERMNRIISRTGERRLAYRKPTRG